MHSPEAVSRHRPGSPDCRSEGARSFCIGTGHRAGSRPLASAFVRQVSFVRWLCRGTSSNGVDRLRHGPPACPQLRLTGQGRFRVPGCRRLSTSPLAGAKLPIPCRASRTLGSRVRAGCGRLAVARFPYRRCQRREPGGRLVGGATWHDDDPGSHTLANPDRRLSALRRPTNVEPRWTLWQGPRAYAELVRRARREAAWSQHAQPAPASARTATNPATGVPGNRMRLMSRPGDSVNAPVRISASM